jgi:hypothetical protein
MPYLGLPSSTTASLCSAFENGTGDSDDNVLSLRVILTISHSFEINLHLPCWCRSHQHNYFVQEKTKQIESGTFKKMVPKPKPQEHQSPMAAAADAALRDLIRISSIGGGDERILTFGDPPLDHIVEDDDSYEMIVTSSPYTSPPPPEKLNPCHHHSQSLSQNSKATTTQVENTGYAPTSPTRRGAGPVDLDAVDDMSVSLDSRLDIKCFDSSVVNVQEILHLQRPTAPVDLDETVVDDGESTILENCLPRPVDLDSVQEREEDFSMIWKEHEDEFLVWKGNEQLQMLALKNARARQKPSYGHSCRENGNKMARALKNNKYITEEEHQEDVSSAIVINYDDDEGCQQEDIASVSSRSLDTFGFSLTEASVDSYGFSLKGSKPKQGTPLALSSPQEDTSTVSSSPSVQKTVSSSESSRARTIQRIKDVLNKEQDPEDSSTVEGLGAKARGLRALRLRSANYKRTQRIEPTFSTVHEHEEFSASNGNSGARQLFARDKEHQTGMANEEQKESFAVFDYPGNYGLVVKVEKDRADTAQSVVSDITNLSDKLFLRVKTAPESKWDDVSSVGLHGVEVQPKVHSAEAEDYDLMNGEEISPSRGDIVEPPIYYDASVKTPPFLFIHEKFEEMRTNSDEDPESKWDDVSSIGLLGVEGVRKGVKKYPTPGEVRIPIVVTSCKVHHVHDDSPQNQKPVNFCVEGEKSNQKCQSQDIFRPRQEAKATSKTPDISINQTFSTVWTGSFDSSSASGDFQDPEMQEEVSCASESLAIDSKQSTISRRAALTPRDWLIIVAILLVTITAIVIVVFYVYANL